MTSVPTLDAIAADATTVKHLPRAVLEDLALRAITVHAAVTTALVAAPSEREAPKDDRLLSVKDVAARLQRSPDWVRRHVDELPFAIIETGRQTRFSLLGLERYIRSRQAEPVAGRKGR